MSTLPPRIGPYPITAALGQGAMGSVYLGQHPRLGTSVALKVLNERDPELVARFQREAEVMARIRHPNVVEVYEAGLHEGLPYLVMEYCPGTDLERHLKERGALQPGQAAALTAAAARGVAAAHAQGVVHRDLKPANVLLTASGPKVTDFGIARAPGAAGVRSLTQTGALLGTPVYMAPEQLDDARQADARSDVYALGAILFELLCAQRPVEGKSLLQLANNVLAGHLRALPAEVPAPFREAVACAMALDPADRYSSASLLAETLEALARSGAHGASASGERSAWRLLALAAGAGLSVCVGLALWGRGAGGSPAPQASPREELRSEVPAASSPEDVGEAAPAPTPSLPPAPAGNTRAFFSYRSALYRAPLEELRARAARGEAEALLQLALRVLQGRAGEQTQARVLELLERAVAAGSPEAAERLARVLERAESGSPRIQQLLRSASEAGSYSATAALAIAHQDRALSDLAGRQLERAVAAGDPEALAFRAGQLLSSGDVLSAIRTARQAADGGSVSGAVLWANLVARDRALVDSRLAVYREAIELGDARAMAEYARVLFDGRLVTRDSAQARRLCLAAVNLGEGSGACVLALQAETPAERARLIDEALRLGSTDGLALRAIDLLDEAQRLTQVQGPLGPPPPDVARLTGIASETLTRAIAAGTLIGEAYRRYGLLLQGRSAEGAKQALNLFERGSLLGDPTATLLLGVAYRDGLGVGADLAAAEEHFHRAAEEGEARAWYALAWLYAPGSDGSSGLAADLGKAKEFAARGARLEDAPSARLLGSLLHREGRANEALTLFRRAWRWGDDEAGIECALMLLTGDGTVRDVPMARRTLEKIAGRGSRRACQALITHLSPGGRLPPDEAAAADWRELDQRLAQAGVR